VTTRRVVLPAYDSGGDDGTTYKAADKNTHPKKATTRNTNRHFTVHAAVQPVATLTFVRKP